MPVVVLPSGVTVSGRRRDRPPPDGADLLVALGTGPVPSWPVLRVRWPDFGVPVSTREAVDALTRALARARAGDRVEVACRGGRGRTGTALAALAVLDGLDPDDAVRWVRTVYDERAVETPWQSWWVRHRVPRS